MIRFRLLLAYKSTILLNCSARVSVGNAIPRTTRQLFYKHYIQAHFFLLFKAKDASFFTQPVGILKRDKIRYALAYRIPLASKIRLVKS